MSVDLVRAARPLAMSPTDKAVLMALADAARDPADPDYPGQAWLPMRGRDGKVGLVEWTCLTDRAVQQAVKRLVLAGHLTRTERPGRGVTYTVHPRTTFAPNHVRPEGGSVTPEPRSDKAPISTNLQKASPSSGDRPAKSAPAAKPKAQPVGVLESLPELPAGVTAEQWAEFVDMRRTMERGGKKRPWTLAAARGIIRDLHRIAARGDDPAAALERSITNGWAGVLFDKGDGNGNRASAGERNDAGNGGGGRTVTAARRVLARMGGSDGWG